VSAQIQKETLAKKIGRFSVAIIRNFRGQDKRSGTGPSVWLGFLRFFCRTIGLSGVTPHLISLIHSALSGVTAAFSGDCRYE